MTDGDIGGVRHERCGAEPESREQAAKPKLHASEYYASPVRRDQA